MDRADLRRQVRLAALDLCLAVCAAVVSQALRAFCERELAAGGRAVTDASMAAIARAAMHVACCLGRTHPELSAAATYLGAAAQHAESRGREAPARCTAALRVAREALTRSEAA